VVFFDMDRFKAVNDGLGHAAGDLLLKEVARRIQGALRECDTLAVLHSPEHTAARLGGDEFGVVLEDVAGAAAVLKVAERLAATLAQPVTLSGQTFVVTASMGVAVYPQQGKTSEDLMACADEEMYRAKGSDPARHRIASRNVQVRPRESLHIESALRRALTRGELVLHYQPQWNLRTGTLTGVEALLRWARARDRLLLPDAFIGVLNDSGLMPEVGRWVLDTACAQAAVWRKRIAPGLRMGVNVSGCQLTSASFISDVQASLRRSGMPAECLELEIVEDALLPDAAAIGEVLAALCEHRVRIALDDFGTGFSSLSHLHDHVIHTAKLDRTFVSELGRSARSGAIVAGMIDLAHRLGMQVVAEGVETRGQLDLLREFGCDSAQGYLLGRPVPARQLARLAGDPLASGITPAEPVSANDGPVAGGSRIRSGLARALLRSRAAVPAETAHSVRGLEAARGRRRRTS
jgi:diguanylate cyclase (GGDEF)-like protein